MRIHTAVLAAAILLTGCGSGNSAELISQTAGTCFNSSGTLTLFSDVETVECSEEHRYQVAGTGELLGERIAADRAQQAENACRSIAQQVLRGRDLPAGASLEAVYDRRASGNIRGELVCVIDRGGMRTGAI